MSDVFFSYARFEDKESPFLFDQNGIISDFYEQLKNRYQTLYGDSEFTRDLIFFDRTNIKPGDVIGTAITEALKDASVLIAFISPSYFNSEWCFKEWEIFDNNIVKKYIPIIVNPISDTVKGSVTNKSRQHATWVQTLAKDVHYIDEDIFRPKNKQKEDELKKEIDRICETIKEYEGRARGVVSEPDASNIFVIEDRIMNSLKDEKYQAPLRGYKKKHNTRPVLVIYAGGTVGMIRAKDSDENHVDFVMADDLAKIVDLLRPKLSSQPFDMVFVSLQRPIDSSNIRASDWTDLASVIEEQMDNYQGFVILHGTNTLAYTASALSFILENLDRPVIITGSEVPLEDINTDAEHNVINAIRAAAPDSKSGPIVIPEVCVFYGNNLYRGNRTTRKYASDRQEGFHSPNMPSPLAILKNDKLSVDTTHRKESLGRKRNIIKPLSAKIAVLLMYPEMNLAGYKDLINNYTRLDGVILLSYGSGNTPDKDEFISFIDYLLRDQKAIVVNITQCHYGKVELKLFETNAMLSDMGVVNGGDMTLEAAYTKLMWLLAKFGSTKQAETLNSIKNQIQRNLRGELSASSHTFVFKRITDFEERQDQYGATVYNSVHRSIPADSLFDRYDIEDAFVRITGVRINWEAIKDNPNVEFVLYYGQPDLGFKESRNEACALVSFTRSFSAKEVVEDEVKFDKNLETSHTFRKNFSKEEPLSLQFGTIDSIPFSFDTVQLIVYTRERQWL